MDSNINVINLKKKLFAEPSLTVSVLSFIFCNKSAIEKNICMTSRSLSQILPGGKVVDKKTISYSCRNYFF